MKKFFLIFMLTAVLAVPAYSQAVDTGAANFLTITPDARSAAMGTAGAASHYGVFSMFHNPALMGFDRNGGVGYSYSPWMKGDDAKTLHTVGASYGIGARGNIFAGFRSFTYKPFDIYNELGQVSGTFKPKEWAAELGYSMLFGNDFSAGVTARWVNSEMNSSAKAGTIAVDLGVAYRRGLSIGDGAAFSATLAATNFGGKMKYNNASYDLPGKIKLGLGLDMLFAGDHGLEVLVDAGYRLMPSDVAAFEAGIGLQYRFMDMIMLRGGYQISDPEKGFGNYVTFGAGVKFYHVQLDAAYMIATGKESIIGDMLRLSLSFDFGLFSRK